MDQACGARFSLAQYQSTVGGRPCVERHLRRIAELVELGDVRAAALGAACRRRAGDQFDLAAGMGGDARGEVGDGDLLGGADVIDAEVLALGAHHHDAADQIVDVAEAAGLAAVALESRTAACRLGCCAATRLQAQRELRDDVLPAHVGAVDVVRPEDQHAVEELAAVVDRHQLADDLAAAVGIARIGRIGHDQRRVSRRSGRAAASDRPPSSTPAPASATPSLRQASITLIMPLTPTSSTSSGAL